MIGSDNVRRASHFLRNVIDRRIDIRQHDLTHRLQHGGFRAAVCYPDRSELRLDRMPLQEIDRSPRRL